MLAEHHLALVAIGGLTGAIVRYRIDAAISKRSQHHLALGTLTVNLIGSFLIGLIYAWTKHHFLSAEYSIFLVTGFLGAFTTFSTYTLNTFLLLENKKVKEALMHLLLYNIIGLFMVFLGSLLGSRF